MNNRNLPEHWGFKDSLEKKHRVQGERSGVDIRTEPDSVINYNLDSGQEINDPYFKELLEVVLSAAAVTREDDISTIVQKLRSGGLEKFGSESIHEASFFKDKTAKRWTVKVLPPRRGYKDGIISLPIFLIYKNEKVLLFINSDRDGLLKYLRADSAE